MSMPISTDKVSAVLLVDGWHKIARGSFNLDAYEFTDGGEGLLGGGGTGATWGEVGSQVCCPIASVWAVRLG